MVSGREIVRGQDETALRAEVLALRHQLGVLERQVGRPRWQRADSLVLAAISRILPRPAWRALLPSPETLLHWHRELVRRKWAPYRRRPRRRRANAHSELHELILKLARENDGWGFRRIVGELRKLGHRCSYQTVRRVLRRHGLEPALRRSHRSWREFVRQDADQILATDFFSVDTVWLSRLYLLFFIEVGSRRVHLAGCTYRLSAEWVAQQVRNLAWRLQEGELKAQWLTPALAPAHTDLRGWPTPAARVGALAPGRMLPAWARREPLAARCLARTPTTSSTATPTSGSA